jgi:Lrp/AsnC family leucine-responsive transcriptional regulator
MAEDLIKLDKKDRKILYYLDLDSRQPLSQLAKKVGLSKQVVDYRIKNLLKRRVISQFYTVINFSKLGYSQYKLYFKFQNVDLKQEKEIIDYWTSSKNSIWVASCRGRWDLAVSLLAQNVNILGETLGDFINKYAEFILEKNILITQISPVFTKTYLTEQKEKKEFIFGGKVEHYKLDEIEKKILRILSTNARISILDLMEKTRLSRDVINYRLKKLKKDGIISQYRILIDLNKIGYRLYKIILRLQSLSQQKEKELIYFIKQHPNGVQFLKLLGNWDAELEFEVKDEEQLHKILLDVRNKFSDIIRDYDTLLIHEEHKLNFFPF